MPGRDTRYAAGPEPARGPAARVLGLLERRIAAGRADTSASRDPDFIRRQLPAIARYTSYFTPEVRGLDRLPAEGPALVVGNHSCLFYVPEAWTCGQAVLSRRGIDAPAYVLAYDLLFAVPGVGPFLRRLGIIPASTAQAESALARGACVLVYPGGDLEACRPWTQRDKVDFGGRTGFVRLALRCGVPVVPVAAHGGHHAVVVLSRGDRLARAAGLHALRIQVLPVLAGLPFGIQPVLAPPMPAHLNVEFLPALDWTGYGPGAADDARIVSACYADITGRLQAALDRLRAENPYPVLQGSARLAGGALRRVRDSLR
jgi:1-acyl-sn-glycerol-3-phosphate acyltransferase